MSRLVAVTAVIACTLAFVIFGHRGTGPAPAPLPSPTPVAEAETRAREVPPSPSPAAPSGLHWPLSLPRMGPPPARLDVVLEHPLRRGRIRVWVDDALLIDKPLTSRITRKVLVYKERRGLFHETVDAPPGDHQVRVRVDGDGFDEERRLRARLSSNATSRLSLDVGGILTKDLEVAWKP